MVMKYGMSRLGHAYFQEDGVRGGEGGIQGQREEINIEVRALVEEAYQEAKNLLEEHKVKLLFFLFLLFLFLLFLLFSPLFFLFLLLSLFSLHCLLPSHFLLLTTFSPLLLPLSTS